MARGLLTHILVTANKEVAALSPPPWNAALGHGKN